MNPLSMFTNQAVVPSLSKLVYTNMQSCFTNCTTLRFITKIGLTYLLTKILIQEMVKHTLLMEAGLKLAEISSQTDSAY